MERRVMRFLKKCFNEVCFRKYEPYSICTKFSAECSLQRMKYIGLFRGKKIINVNK